MKIDSQSIWADLQAIKKHSPLIHNITNYVVMEHTANSLLAIGAAPVMAHAAEEVEEMIKIANALVLNIGTLSNPWITAMMLALKAANTKNIPVIFDPVGAGATSYRTDTAWAIINHGTFAAIRGNASEIASLNGYQAPTKGVDSLLSPHDHQEKAVQLAAKKGCVVWMSGATDVITNGEIRIFVHNGHPLMSQVTGMGCTATAITAAFLTVNHNPLLGCAHAAMLMGVVGEIAAKACKGPGSFKLIFMDTLYTISLDDLTKHLRFNFYVEPKHE